MINIYESTNNILVTITDNNIVWTIKNNIWHLYRYATIWLKMKGKLQH